MLDLLELAPGSSRRRVIKLKPFQRNRSKFAGLSFGWPGKWGRRLASRSGIEFRPTTALGPSRILVAECFKQARALNRRETLEAPAVVFAGGRCPLAAGLFFCSSHTSTRQIRHFKLWL